LLTFIARRFATALLVLLALSAMLFALQSLSPADPVRTLVGDHASASVVAAARHHLGYDRPWISQYLSYVGGIFHLDLQHSLRTHHSVTTDLGNVLPASIELLVAASFLAILGGLVLGIALSRSSWLSSMIRVVMLTAASIPSFLFGILAILLFYSRLGWFPAVGQTSASNPPNGPTHFLILDSLLHGEIGTFGDALRHLVLPALSLAFIPAVAIGRSLGSSLISTQRSDYVKTARIKGLKEWQVVVKHCLRNCMNATLAMTGLQIGALLGSLTIVEVVFSWPGLGNYLSLSVNSADLPSILGVALVIGAIFIFVNFLVDVLQSVADPRIAYR
jgi:peptide/nickel transport system permease protein